MIYRIDKDNKPVPVSNAKKSTTVVGGLPVGFMMMFAGETIPEGYLPAWGQSLERAEYTELFEIIGTRFGAVDDDHFSLPDTREVAIVGAGTNSKLSNDVYTEGQFKEHQFASHTHAQASHTHTGTAHTHTMNHTHTGTAHSHGSYSRPSAYQCNLLQWPNGMCTNSVTCYTGSSSPGSSSTNICLSGATTVGSCAATATNNVTGSSSGGTHGKRMGIYYIIKVEAD